MTFVFSFWYIVLVLLLAGVVASIFAFMKMDKKDKVLIDDFIKEATEEADGKSNKKVDSKESKKE